ncbi:hypothetical protein GCM10022419_005070 [Nonomuraea rosea]|uniref:Uncharacterized protein n=1 Tax=Nonomuraea rosea TaxID=638574 RepID=A0ABP6V652_9ACTN
MPPRSGVSRYSHRHIREDYEPGSRPRARNERTAESPHRDGHDVQDYLGPCDTSKRRDKTHKSCHSGSPGAYFIQPIYSSGINDIGRRGLSCPSLRTAIRP